MSEIETVEQQVRIGGNSEAVKSLRGGRFRRQPEVFKLFFRE